LFTGYRFHGLDIRKQLAFVVDVKREEGDGRGGRGGGERGRGEGDRGRGEGETKRGWMRRDWEKFLRFPVFLAFLPPYPFPVYACNAV